MYFKITNKKEKHHGYQYKDGLNVLNEEFNQTGSCVAGGFYFTTLEHISKFYGYGINIRVVELPESDRDFLMVKDPESDKWRANKIILGKKYSLFDPITYQELGLNITENNYLINNASRHGCLDVLKRWKKSGLILKYTHDAIDTASKNGHTHILDWWLNSGFELKYSNNAIEYASGYGRVNVLEWWKKSGLKLKYSCSAIDFASHGCHLNVLDWWINSGLKLKYTSDAFNFATNTDTHVFDWWKNSGLEIKSNFCTMDQAIEWLCESIVSVGNFWF